jgi:prepilin signal peptidase PulO-like enzyme (type II secretory pathway)
VALFCLIAFPVLGLYGPWDGLLGLIVPTLFFGLLFFGSRGRWLGGGDLRIGLIMGAVLGYPMVILGLFLGYVFGAVFSVVGLLTKKVTRKSKIPFAPFLLLGTYVTLFWGEIVWEWYFGMF